MLWEGFFKALKNQNWLRVLEAQYNRDVASKFIFVLRIYWLNQTEFFKRYGNNLFLENRRVL